MGGGLKRRHLLILATKTHRFLSVVSAFSRWKRGEGSCYRKEQNCVTEKSKRGVFNERAKHEKVCHVKRTEVCLTFSLVKEECGSL